MKKRPSRVKTEHWVLIGILTVALFLRAWGVRFGLPYAYHIDEPTYVSAALNLGAGIIGKQPNPTGFSNILFGAYGSYFALGRILGVFGSVADFEQAYRTDSSNFLLLSRLTSVIIGTANVAVAYWLGKVVRNQLVGLLAASFLAVGFLHVRDSHFGVPDITATFFVSLSVLLASFSFRRGELRWIIISAAIAGLAVATKWSVLWAMLPVGLAVLWHIADSTGSMGGRCNKRAVVATASMSFFVGLLVGGFQLLLRPATFLEYALREARSGAAGGFGYWQVDVVPGWLFYLRTLVYGLGIGMVVLAALGLVIRSVVACRSRGRISYLLLAFPVVYFLAMGATRHYFARYALPLLPYAAVLSADAVHEIARWLGGRGCRFGRGVAAILFVAALAQPLASSIRHDWLLIQTDTRTVAKEWIEQNIPEGAKIAVDWPTHSPPLATSATSVVDSNRVYDVTVVGGTGLAEHSLAWYRENGFDYLIASSFIYQIPLVFADEDRERRAFYDALEHELTVMDVFWPTASKTELPFLFDEIYGPAVSLWQRERPGPTIRIYVVSPSS